MSRGATLHRDRMWGGTRPKAWNAWRSRQDVMDYDGLGSLALMFRKVYKKWAAWDSVWKKEDQVCVGVVATLVLKGTCIKQEYQLQLRTQETLRTATNPVAAFSKLIHAH